jgi:hypothetical protein
MDRIWIAYTPWAQLTGFRCTSAEIKRARLANDSRPCWWPIFTRHVFGRASKHFRWHLSEAPGCVTSSVPSLTRVNPWNGELFFFVRRCFIHRFRRQTYKIELACKFECIWIFEGHHTRFTRQIIVAKYKPTCSHRHVQPSGSRFFLLMVPKLNIKRAKI